MLDEQFLSRLTKQNQALGEQVRRWMPKLTNIANDISKVTGEPFEDCLMDAIEKMCINVKDHSTVQVRHNKRIWEIVEDGPTLRLTNYARTKTIEIPREDCEPVKKSSLGTFVYQGLLQHCADKFAKTYTEKNGYRMDPVNPKVERTLLDRTKRQLVRKQVSNYIRVTGEQSCRVIVRHDGTELDEIDLAEGMLESVEDRLVFEGYLHFLQRNLSKEANDLLDFLLQENQDYQDSIDLQILDAQHEGKVFNTPRIDLTTAAKYFGWDRAKLKTYWGEIILALPEDFLTEFHVVVKDKEKYYRVNLVKEIVQTLPPSAE